MNISRMIITARIAFLKMRGFDSTHVFLGVEEIIHFEQQMIKDLQLPLDFDFKGHVNTMILDMPVIAVKRQSLLAVGVINSL